MKKSLKLFLTIDAIILLWAIIECVQFNAFLKRDTDVLELAKSQAKQHHQAVMRDFLLLKKTPFPITKTRQNDATPFLIESLNTHNAPSEELIESFEKWEQAGETLKAPLPFSIEKNDFAWMDKLNDYDYFDHSRPKRFDLNTLFLLTKIYTAHQIFTFNNPAGLPYLRHVASLFLNANSLLANQMGCELLIFENRLNFSHPQHKTLTWQPIEQELIRRYRRVQMASIIYLVTRLPKTPNNGTFRSELLNWSGICGPLTVALPILFLANSRDSSATNALKSCQISPDNSLFGHSTQRKRGYYLDYLQKVYWNKSLTFGVWPRLLAPLFKRQIIEKIVAILMPNLKLAFQDYQ